MSTASGWGTMPESSVNTAALRRESAASMPVASADDMSS